MVTLRNIFTHHIALGMVSLMGLFSACDMMEGVYDNPEDTTADSTQTQNGQTADENGVRQYYINAASFTQWIYIDLHTDPITITTADYNPADQTETGAPTQWDYAHHRYDIKTNGAEVWMTPYHSIAELEAAGLPATIAWVADTYKDEAFITDLSHMLEGNIYYSPGYTNAEAGRWLNVDLSTMPPIYTMHDNVLLYHLADGTMAAIQLVNFMSTDRYQTKGWMTVNYKYPVF